MVSLLLKLIQITLKRSFFEYKYQNLAVVESEKDQNES